MWLTVKIWLSENTHYALNHLKVEGKVDQIHQFIAGLRVSVPATRNKTLLQHRCIKLNYIQFKITLLIQFISLAP